MLQITNTKIQRNTVKITLEHLYFCTGNAKNSLLSTQEVLKWTGPKAERWIVVNMFNQTLGCFLRLDDSLKNSSGILFTHSILFKQMLIFQRVLDSHGCHAYHVGMGQDTLANNVADIQVVFVFGLNLCEKGLNSF